MFLTKDMRGIKGQSKSKYHLREVFFRLLNAALDTQQKSGLPLVQLAKLVELEQLIGKRFLIATLHGLEQVDEKLVLAGRGKGGIDFTV